MKFIILLISTVLLFELSLFVNGQTDDGSCGGGCGPDLCCSQYGYCGESPDYCGAGCQPTLGKCTSTSTSTTTTTTPATTSTSTTKSVSSTTTTTTSATASPTKAVEITTCKVANSVALTFDDGPSEFTHTLLDTLKNMNVKATFFINGNNYGCIYDYADVILRAKNDGHQIASHTWAHLDLATLTKDKITSQMKQLDDALIKIMGASPTYMRPPFGSGVNNNLVMTTLGTMGYKVITWNLDTNDWKGTSTAQSLNLYNNAAPPFIALNHDTVQNTALDMGPKAFQAMLNKGYKISTVGGCLGDDPSNWYRNVGQPQARDSTWHC